MSDGAFQRAMALFEAACELPREERAAFLDRACNEETALRAEVEQLLAADDIADTSFLTKGGGAKYLAQRVVSEESMPGRSVPSMLGGKYRILRRIGQGGMGEVFEAEQAVPRRRVAIKLMRPGLSSARALRRFEHEAHVLGRLQHPGIAQIFEVGAVSSDRPDDAFFAMELIDGLSVDEYAQTNALSVADRLELVARICDAVHHAHQRGVIHRDLKPANILVESSGQPKILDFGVARVANDDSLLTRQLTTAGQIVGTLAYMSPEQVSGDPAQIDVRCDVYAIGVILYQLLARRLPLDPGSRGLSEALRMIKEDDPPTLGSLDRSLRGDVETIVLKALEKSPARRYQSAAELADDIRRSLRGEPIVARQHSALYLGRTLIRRHPVISVAASLLAISLMAFLGYSQWQADRYRDLADSEYRLRLNVEQAQRESERLRVLATDTATSLRRKLRESDVERGRLFARAGTMAIAESLLWPELLRDPSSLPARYGLRDAYRTQGLEATVHVCDHELTSISARPDGALVVGDGSGGIHVLDPLARAVRRTVTLDSPIVVLDARGAGIVAVACADRTLRLLDAETLAPLATSPATAVRSLAIAPDGRRIAVAFMNRTVGLLSLPSLETLWTSTPLDVVGQTLAWSRDGKMLAAAGTGHTAHILTPRPDDPTSANETRVLAGHTGGIAALCWAPDGRTIWSGSSDRTVRRWDVASGEETARWRYANGTIRHAVLSADASTLVVAGWWSIDRLDAATGARLRSVSSGVGATGLVLRGDGADASEVATVHPDGDVRLWEFDEYADRWLIATVSGPGRCAFSRSAPLRAVIGDASGHVRVVEATSGAATMPERALGSGLRAVRFAVDDTVVVAQTLDGSLHVIDSDTGTIVASATHPPDPLSTSLSVSPDGTRTLVGLPNGVVRLYHLPDLALEAETQAGVGSITGVAFEPDGQHFVAIGRQRALTRRDLAMNELARSTASVGTPWAPAFSLDGTRVASGTWSQAVQFWTLPTLELEAKFLGHRALPWLVRFNPGDPRLLHTAGEDGMLNTWDLADGTLLATERPFPSSDLSGLDVSSDGRLAIVASSLGDIVVIDLAFGDRAVEGNRAAAEMRWRAAAESAAADK